MTKEVKVKVSSKIDEYELEMFCDGSYDSESRILRYTEVVDNHNVENELLIGESIKVKRSNGVNMSQEFIEGQQTMLHLEMEGIKLDIQVFTDSLIVQEGYIKIKYSTGMDENEQRHILEISYT